MSPKMRMVLGLTYMPAFLLQESAVVRSVQLLLIVMLYIFQGGKFRILPNLILITSIITAYLIRPAGMVLFSIGRFSVTQGALLSGISRSLLLMGLIYISRLSVSSRLRFNSSAGNLLGRVFFYFEVITERNHAFPFKHLYRKGGGAKIISYFDDLLVSVESRGSVAEIKDNTISGFSPITLIPIVVFIAVSYILLII